MGSLIGLLVGKTVFGKAITEPVARFLVTAGLFLVALGACAGLVAAYNSHVIGAHETAVIKKSIPAINQAASERATDTVATAKHEQEAHDVIAAQPDQAIAPTSHALACKRLRDAGRTPAACR